MKIIAEQLKQLRESVKLSQKKMSTIIGCQQSSLARYETGATAPPLELILWYADYFDVSMDYIFGRTDKPQGKLYEYNPKITADSEQLRLFVEMCFDPNSPVSEKLKKSMMELFLKDGENQK
ncbi:MAG: helix-turn-helix domain-containing protein [Oscillospiraceae bacterium]|nr:helix-turn-helix domain-containing protein [Oscillospiraceae bacterium]